MGGAFSNFDVSLSNKPSLSIRGQTYRVLNLIGRGGEGIVFRCEDQKGFRYAVKIFLFSHYPSAQRKIRIKSFKQEAKILKYLSGRSRHFIYLYDYQYKRRENIGYLLMELGDESLRKRLKGEPLNERSRKFYWKQIVKILSDLEDSQIVHADIKPENMIFVNDVLKITDLGLAFRLPENQDIVRRSLVRGTLDYMAPEVFSHRTGFKSDVWSAGIILYEMTYGRPPYFSIRSRNRKISAISSRKPIHFAPIPRNDLLSCMKRCLQFEPHRRPSPDRLLSLPYTRN